MYSAQQFKLVSSYGDFFHQWAWDHYATFTFARQQSHLNCLRHWSEFIESLGRTTRGRVGWVRADEQRSSGCGTSAIPLHFHALLKYRNVSPAEAVAALWKAEAGVAKVEDYHSGGGAAFYLAKMLPYEGAGYGMGGLEYFPRSEDSPIRSRVQWLRKT
jgi:hypothetical protein